MHVYAYRLLAHAYSTFKLTYVNTSFCRFPQMGHSSTHTICGCGISIPPHAPPVRKRHQLELALMGRGDIVNGTIVFGMAPSLAVVARTTVRRH